MRSLDWLCRAIAAIAALVASTQRDRERRRYQKQCYLDAMREAGRG